METELREAEVVNTSLVVRERSSVLLAPVMDVNTARARLKEFQEFVDGYLTESKDGGQDGGDYGVIPGTKKKTLLKSGADKLCELYGLADTYRIKATIDWDKKLFDYEITCILKSRRDDSEVGEGLGSCSSYESKYLWREAKRKCPNCGKETIIKGQQQYGGGWICWFKEGKSDGCKAKFGDNDPKIVDQVVGRIENPDIIDVKNTVLKIAKKRAKVDAVIGVTRSSGIFTQDEELVGGIRNITPEKPPVPVTTEDIPLTKAPGAASGPVAAVVGNNKAWTSDLGGPVTPEISYCSKAENNSFFANIRAALPDPLKVHTETIGRQFLKHKGYQKKSGEGSLQNVEKALFPELMKECMAYIDSVKATLSVNEHGLAVSDADLPENMK